VSDENAGEEFVEPEFQVFEVGLGGKTGGALVNELGDGGQSMQGITEAQASWLRTRVTEVPRSGNTLLVTHQPNLSRAFPDWGSAVEEGETVVIRPDAKGGISVVGRIRIGDWSLTR